MTVKCGANYCPESNNFLFSNRNPDVAMDQAMSPSSTINTQKATTTTTQMMTDAKNWSPENGKKFDKIDHDVDVDKDNNKADAKSNKNSSSRLSFSVDSLLSSIRKNPVKPVVDRDKPVEPDKPSEYDDDDEDGDLDIEDDSDDYVDDEDEHEAGSNPANRANPEFNFGKTDL